MKINVGGKLIDQDSATVELSNSAFLRGDVVKEVFRLVNGAIINWEDHYFNLMASMRIFRMNIPLSFTPEFFQEQVKLVAEANQITTGKITFQVYRLFSTDLLKAEIDFLVTLETSENAWELYTDHAEIDVFKDYVVNPSFYSTVPSNRPEEVIAEIYSLENDYADVVLLNANKRMARTLKGAIFVLNDQTIKTPKVEEGVIKSVLRTNFIQSFKNAETYTLEETEIFPFEIQKAEEVFILVDGVGILSITQNRKKIYQTNKTKEIFNQYFKD